LTTPQEIIKRASDILDGTWSAIKDLGQQDQLHDFLDDETVSESIRAAINSRTKTYRYVLPTQIVAKLANENLDCRCVQVTRGGKGAFDARSLAHKVIVPFDQSNESVLGGSAEPYVNNPLRFPEISTKYRSAQKNKRDWDNLCTVLNLVEDKGNREFTLLVFKQILIEVYRRLLGVRVAYPAPIRISLQCSIGILEQFLSIPSGGDRLLALTSALFVVIGKRFRLYSNVRRGAITASDAATGMLGDIECISEEGDLVFVVEVKDRYLTISQVRTKIPDIREKQVSEVFFVAQQGIAPNDEADIDSMVTHEFASGHNIYILDLLSLSRVLLALIGEQGRRDFLQEVGNQLDQYGSDIIHRRAWADLLSTI